MCFIKSIICLKLLKLLFSQTSQAIIFHFNTIYNAFSPYEHLVNHAEAAGHLGRANENVNTALLNPT